MLTGTFLRRALLSLVTIPFLAGLAEASQSLTAYSKSPNVQQLDRIISRGNQPKATSKTALFAGYAILYEVAAKDGGAQRFRDFSWDCYDKAFASTHMKNVLACYITINVVVDQLERTLKVKIKDKFDAILVDKLKDEKITDKELISGIFGQFNSAFQSESKWITNLTVKQVSDCIDFGIGNRCKY